MDNYLLTYVLTTVKLDTASHCWVTSLANYNFRLHYRARKANIDADALLRASWPGCMPDRALISKSLLQPCKLCKKLPSRGLLAP